MSEPGASETRTYDFATARKNPDAWWTVLVIDPIAVRVLPWLVTRRSITPDGLSLTSLALAALAGGAFLADWWVVGALLFELHFFLDCLDGKLARVRGTQNARGGFLDLACDLVGTSWCFAAIGISAYDDHRPELSLLTALLYVVYTWSVVHRSKAGALSGPGSGSGWLARHGMVATPYGVEAETLVLFLVPLAGSERLQRAAMLLAVAFYVLASARNLRSTYRGATAK